MYSFTSAISPCSLSRGSGNITSKVFNASHSINNRDRDTSRVSTQSGETHEEYRRQVKGVPVSQSTLVPQSTPVSQPTSMSQSTPVSQSTPLTQTPHVTQSTPMYQSTPVSQPTPVTQTPPVSQSTPSPQPTLHPQVGNDSRRNSLEPERMRKPDSSISPTHTPTAIPGNSSSSNEQQRNLINRNRDSHQHRISMNPPLTSMSTVPISENPTLSLIHGIVRAVDHHQHQPRVSKTGREVESEGECVGENNNHSSLYGTPAGTIGSQEQELDDSQIDPRGTLGQVAQNGRLDMGQDYGNSLKDAQPSHGIVTTTNHTSTISQSSFATSAMDPLVSLGTKQPLAPRMKTSYKFLYLLQTSRFKINRFLNLLSYRAFTAGQWLIRLFSKKNDMYPPSGYHTLREL